MDIRRYDIVQADLGKAVGSEQAGIRPVLIVQNDQGNKFSNTTIIIPLTSKLKSLNQPTHTLIRKSIDTGLRTDSVLLGEQMRVISSQRIIKKIGSVTDKNEQKDIVKRTYVFYSNKSIDEIEAARQLKKTERDIAEGFA